MSFPKYPNYKPSGVEWLGDVPAHWEVRRLKAVASHNDDVLDETTSPNDEIAYVDIASVDAINGVSATETMRFCDSPSRARRRVRHGDVIVSTVRTYLRAIACIREPAENLIVSTGFAVVRPGEQLVPNFLGHALTASHFVEQVIARSTGVSYPAINASELVAIPILVPPKREQTAIASFLDRETSKIDSLVAEQRRLIELLKEKRQAVISHAVTKGLNPHAPMKPSGIEWLGDVPAHWELVRIKHVAFGFMYGTSADCNSEDSGTPVLRIPNVKDGFLDFTDLKFANFDAHEEEKYLVHDGDILVVRTNGNPELVGKSALFRGDLRCMFASYLIKIRPKASISPEFLILVMNAACTREMLTLTARTSAGNYNMNCEGLGQTHLMLPSLVEQDAIVAALNGVLAEFDALISEAERAIELLQERRTALISAAVTGKIDVRTLQEAN